jgi:hypothetical protein
MKIVIHKLNDSSIAEVIADEIIIKKTQDALDIMGDCFFNGSKSIIFHEKNISGDFFDLKTRIAGDILQKFSTYGMRLAIVGDFSKYTSKSLKDFIFESNKFGRINFVSSVDEAKEKLMK